MFETILSQYPNLNMDLFASRLNHQLEQYASWKPDPGSLVVLALTGIVMIFMHFHHLALSPGVCKRFGETEHWV